MAAKMVKEDCTRCNGTGHFSFNFVHGTVCYGCRGQGYKMTSEATIKARVRRQEARKAAKAEEATAAEARKSGQKALIDALTPIFGYGVAGHVYESCHILERAVLVLARKHNIRGGYNNWDTAAAHLDILLKEEPIEDYVITFGKFAGKKLNECPTNYIGWVADFTSGIAANYAQWMLYAK